MRFLALIVAFVTSPAMADLEAVWDVKGEGKMVISMRDANNIRMDMGEEGYLLLDDGTMYSVSREDGKWVAVDMAEIGQMMGRTKGPGQSSTDEDAEEYDFELVDTGKKETIAGYTGTVYDVVPGDGRGKETAVLSKHEDVVKAQEAFAAMAGAMAGAVSDSVPSLPDDLPGGLLRNGDLTLVSIDKKDKPDGWFDLPEGTTVQSMRSMMQGFAPPLR